MKALKKVLKNKILSRRGASVIFALLFLMVASMVSIVILDASVTTAKRLRDDTVREQDNLTLTSAGKLMRECLVSSDSLTANTVCTVTTVTNSETGLNSVTVSADGPISGIIENAVRSVISTGSEFSGSFTIQPNSANDAEGVFKKVSVRFTLVPDQSGTEGADTKDSYKLSAVLSLAGSDMKLYMTAYRSITSEPTVSPDGLTTTELIYWTTVTMSTKEGAD